MEESVTENDRFCNEGVEKKSLLITCWRRNVKFRDSLRSSKLQFLNITLILPKELQTMILFFKKIGER